MGFLKKMSGTNRSNLITYALVVIAFIVVQALVSTDMISY